MYEDKKQKKGLTQKFSIGTAPIMFKYFPHGKAPIPSGTLPGV